MLGLFVMGFGIGAWCVFVGACIEFYEDIFRWSLGEVVLFAGGFLMSGCGGGALVKWGLQL